MSLDDAWKSYTQSCECGNSFKGKNCAHFLSNALIKGGFTEIDGKKGADQFRTVNGFCVCTHGRPVRAKEMRAWFARKWERHQKPQEGYNAVYQEKSNGQGHVLLQKGTDPNGPYVGTENYPSWSIQEYYY